MSIGRAQRPLSYGGTYGSGAMRCSNPLLSSLHFSILLWLAVHLLEGPLIPTYSRGEQNNSDTLGGVWPSADGLTLLIE